MRKLKEFGNKNVTVKGLCVIYVIVSIVATIGWFMYMGATFGADWFDDIKNVFKKSEVKLNEDEYKEL